VALVTGASRGIGKAIAERLASEGMAVVVNYVAHPDKAQSTVAGIIAAGGTAVAMQADIGALDQVARLVGQVRERFGRVNCLVNNAGQRPNVHPLIEDATVEVFDQIFSTNTRGLYFLTQQILSIMPDGGRIVNISSASTMRKIPGLSIYAGSKAAVEAFTRVWATELAPRGITVNAILPGAVETDLLRQDPERFDQLRSQIPMGRLGTPADIAAVVSLLLSVDAGWLTGLCIPATGGA
jgi:3-oxoacyl-[acyl-carrier protein] reductase